MGLAHGEQLGLMTPSSSISSIASSTIQRLLRGVRYAFWHIGRLLVCMRSAVSVHSPLASPLAEKMSALRVTRSLILAFPVCGAIGPMPSWPCVPCLPSVHCFPNQCIRFCCRSSLALPFLSDASPMIISWGSVFTITTSIAGLMSSSRIIVFPITSSFKPFTPCREGAVCM